MLPKVYAVKLNAFGSKTFSNRVARHAIIIDEFIDALRNLRNRNIDIEGTEIEEGLRHFTTKAIGAYVSHIWSFL